MPQETSQDTRAVIRLPSGKLFYVPEGMDVNNSDDLNYIRSYIAKHLPDEAQALGIELNSAGNALSQMGNEVAVSGGQVVAGVEGLLDWVTGNKSQDDWGAQKFIQGTKENYSLETLADIADDKLGIGDVWRGVTESALPIAAGAATGGAAGLAAKGLGATGAAVTGTGIAAAAATEAGIGAGGSFNNVFQGVMNQKNDPLSPILRSQEFKTAFANAFKEKGNAAEARDAAWEQVAYQQASIAAPGAAVANAVPALIGGTVLQKALAPVVNRAMAGAPKFISQNGPAKAATEFLSQNKVKPIATTLGGAAKVAGAEGVEEALQSGGETMAQNYAMSQVDPRVGLMDDVGESALLGGLSGALGGGIVGGGIGAYKNYQAEQDKAKAEGFIERGEISQDRLAAKRTAGQETMKAATNAAYTERAAAEAELAKAETAKAAAPTYAGIQGNRYKPNAAPQDPAAVPRLGVDKTVQKPETFDYEPPFSVEVARTRGDVRSVIVNGERATIEKPVKQGKKTVVQKVSAADEFDAIFQPDAKLTTAYEKLKAAESQYEYDKAAYNKVPDNKKAGYNRHLADSRRQVALARNAYVGERKAGEARLRKQANQWNAVARKNNLPEVKFGVRAETVSGRASGPAGAIVQAQTAKAAPKTPTTDDFIEESANIESELSILSGRALDMSIPEPERVAAKAAMEQKRTRLDELNSLIEESYGEAGTFDPSAMLDEQGNVNKDALRGDQQRAEQRAILDFSAPQNTADPIEQEFTEEAQQQPVEQQTPTQAEASRLLNASQLPVERTDIKTPRPDQQGREQKLTDEYVYEVAPVSTKGAVEGFNERAARNDGSYTGAPTTGYKIVKTAKGLHGTNIGKPGRQTFATKEEAEDWLADNAKDKTKVNLPKEVWDRAEAKKKDKMDEDRERADQREAYLNIRAKRAFDKVFKDTHDKLIKIAEEELRRVGLLQKGVKIATFDTQRKDAAGGDVANQVYTMIREYNQFNMPGINNKSGTDLAKFGPETMGSFIMYGKKENPLSIIALDRNLISPNMTPDQMKAAVKRVVHHELVHGLVRGGFVTPQEYSTLLRLVRKRKMPGELGKEGGKITYLEYTQAAYADTTQQVQEEEAIAELIAIEGFGVSKTPMGSESRGVIDRIVRVIKAIFGMLGDKDFSKFVDFMEGVKDGSVAQRILNNAGFDPSNTLDPFGRDLGAQRADMRLSGFKRPKMRLGIPMQAPTNLIIDMREKLLKYARENNGQMPKGLSLAQIYGVPHIDMDINFKPDFDTASFIARVPRTSKVETIDRKVQRPDGSSDTIKDAYIKTTNTDVVKLSDVIDISQIERYAPDIARRLGEVQLVSEAYPGTTIAGVFFNKPEDIGQKIYLNGVRTDVISLNAAYIFSMRDMREAQKFIAHEIQHLVDMYAGRGNFPVLSSRGSTTGFTLDNRTPRYTKEQLERGTLESEVPGSEISRTLSFGNNFISSVVNAETQRVVDDMKRGIGDTMTGKMMEGYLRLQDAAEEFNHIFWEGMDVQASRAGVKLAQLHSLPQDAAVKSLVNEIGKLQRLSILNEQRANSAISKTLGELIEGNPEAAAFYSFTAQNLLTSQIFSTLRNVEQNLLSEVKADAPFETMLGRQALYAVADDIARLLDINNSYRSEEGEGKANAAENSSEADPRGVMERVAPVSNISAVNNPPNKWTEDQIGMAFPDMQTSDEAAVGFIENTGSKVYADNNMTPSVEQTALKFNKNVEAYANGNKADMRSGSDMSALSGLNTGDVQILMDIFQKEPLINIEQATRLLNERKTSERRPYRPNEIQGIVNKIAAINPDLARDGTSPEALIKYEKLWGTDRLKGVIAEAELGTPDTVIAKKFGLARASLRVALNEINVQPKNATGGLSPELMARRLPAEWVTGQTYRVTDDNLALGPNTAFNDKGAWNNARGPDYVRQEMLRKSEDGLEGRTLGQIMKSLRDAGYRGGDTPVVNAFVKYESFLRERLDPSTYIGSRADMKSGDNGDDSGKVVDLGLRRAHRDMMGSVKQRVEEKTKLIKEMFGVAGVSPTDVGTKMLAELRREDPILWKRITDGAAKRAKERGYDNEIAENLANHLLHKPLIEEDRTIRQLNQSIENYKKMAEGDADGKTTLTDISSFLNWAKSKYVVPYYSRSRGNRADMKSVSFVGRYKPSEVTPEQWREARKDGAGYGLSDLEFDVFDVINNGPKEGLTTEGILEKLNEYRTGELLGPEDVRGAVVRIKKKNFPINNAEAQRQDRTKRIFELMDAGGRPSVIARSLYAEEIDFYVRRGILTQPQAVAKYSNAVSSNYSQEKKRRRNAELAGQRADLKLTGAADLFKQAMKNNSAGVKKNMLEYALKVEGDAVLDQMTSLHKLFGRFVADPEKLIFEQINTAEGLERILQKYRQAGGKIDADSNPVFQEDESRGKTRPEIERIIDEAFKPILEVIGSLAVTEDMIKELSTSVDVAARWFEAQKENGREDASYNAAGLYLLAKHAPYREAFIKSKRKQSAELRGGEGSLGIGIQLEDAGKIVNFFDQKFGQEEMNKLSDAVAAATKRLTEIRESGGLIPTGLVSMPFYVPARGFAERDGEDDMNFVTLGTGSRGRTPMRQDPITRGRLSLPDDPLTSLAQMMQVAVMRKNVNETLNSLRRLVENNAGLFEKGGTFVAAVHYEKPKGLDLNNEPLWLRGRVIKGDNDMSVGDSSDIFYIELSPEFANIAKHFMPSMFNKGKIENLLQATRVIEPAMNFLRSVRTSKNPAFLPVNLVRDIGTGFFNIEMYLENSQGEFLKRAPTVLAQVMKDIMSGKAPTTKYGKLAQEFIDNGGNQNLYVIDDFDRLAKQIAGKLQKINHGETSVTDKAKQSIIALSDFMEKANNAAELVSRVTAYSIAKERYAGQGMSEKEAIKRGVYIGRNLTVNFNKHGSLGKGMNNLYMFWNASVGGTAQILRAASSNPKVRAQLMSIVALGFAMPFIMRALMGDEWEKIPDWVKDRNFIIPIPGADGGYFTVPLPYGYSWFLSTGKDAAELAYKAQDPLYGPGGAAQWMALRSVDNFMNNFSPTGSSSDVLTLVAPTLADPILELAMNKDWTGRPIMPEPGMRDYDRQSQRYWSNTAPMYTAIADIASGMTGGHNRIDGLIEISPNSLEYITEFVFGGLGKFVNQNVALATGKVEDVSDIPIVRSFAGTTTGEISVAADYSSLQNRVKRVERSIADAQEAGNYNMIQNLESRYAYEVSLIPVFRQSERKIDRLQASRRGIENKYRESDASPNENDRQRLDEIKESIRQIKRQAVEEISAR